MQALNWIAEQRINEAVQAGELDDLPCHGQPLRFDSLFGSGGQSNVPFTILKNAGYLPMPLMRRKEVEIKEREIRILLQACRRRTGCLRQELQRIQNDKLKLNEQSISSNSRGRFSSVFLRSWLKKRQTRNSERASHFRRAYYRTVSEYRERYGLLLTEANAKIEQLKFDCIQEEVRQNLRCSSVLEMAPIDVADKLGEFDAEFSFPDHDYRSGTRYALQR